VDTIYIPETLRAVKQGKESGTNSFIIQPYFNDCHPRDQAGIFFFNGWSSIEDITIESLSTDHDIVVVFSAKDNLKFQDVEMERKFKDLMGSRIEYNPNDKYSRLSMQEVKLFELPKDNIESCYTISKALEQQKLKIAIVVQRAEILLSKDSCDPRLLDNVKNWVTFSNSHTLIMMTDNKDDIHHKIRQIGPPLVRYLEWLPPSKEDFERVFTNLKIIKPHLFNSVAVSKLASACEGSHYLELANLLERMEKEKGVLTEELLKHTAEDATKQIAKNKGGDWIISKKPKVTFNDIAGVKDIEEKIDCKILPYCHPELAKKYGLRLGSGILFIGPHGTGKTMLGEAIANKLGVPFFSISSADIIDKYVGESGKLIRKLLLAARQCKPYGLIFIDEIDSIIPRRDRDESKYMKAAVAQFLAEMDGINTDQKTPVLLIGATNRPQDIDHAALRPGRFDNVILVPLPNKEARRQIFYLNLQYRFTERIDYSVLADMTDGYSGADIANICREAAEKCAIQAVKEKQVRPVTMDIIVNVISFTKKSVSKECMEWFRNYEQNGISWG